MQIYAGSASYSLATSLADNLKLKLGTVVISRFANDEVRVLVQEEKVDREVIIVNSLASPTDHHILEFLMLEDALRRCGAKDVTAIIPYMGYSKQDKVFRVGESLSVKVVAQMLQIMPLTKVITFDLHNPAIAGFYDIPVTNLTASPLFLDFFKRKSLANHVVVAPDAGAVKASSKFAQSLGLDILYINKSRDLNTCEVTIHDITGSVKGLDVIIFDDMIATGSTLIESSKFLHEQGANSVTVCATHYLNVKGVTEKLIASHIDQIITTNSINFPTPTSKFKILNISPLVAQELS